MTGDCHVRFRENAGVKFPCVTRLAAIGAHRTDSENLQNSRMKYFSYKNSFYGQKLNKKIYLCKK